MINHINDSIANVVANKRDFITSKTAFTRNREWDFNLNVRFQIFRERTTTRHDINTFYLESMDHCFSRITRGNYSRRRSFIDPNFYKEVNREYLKQIKYDQNLSSHKTYKGYRLFAIDGMTVRFDNSLELRKEFEVKKPTLKYTQPSEAKFSAIMDVLNGYIIDGELGNFRQSERELLKINIENSKDILESNDSIVTMDRGYISLELMSWLLENKIYFVQRVKNGYYKKEINQIKGL